jgi:hypothetical protein
MSVVLVLVILSLTLLVQATTVGISAGDSMVFLYQICTTYSTPSGNVTSTSNNQFTVNILSVNVSAPRGEVGYTESAIEFNNTVESSSSVTSTPENFTTIFDPYDNLSYLSNIGFWPFTYTDLQVGSVRNLNLKVPVSGTASYVMHINATVARNSGLIDVNLTLVAFAGAHPTVDVLRFNSTNGVLEYGRMTTNPVTNVEKVFIYKLLSFTQPTLTVTSTTTSTVTSTVASATIVFSIQTSPTTTTSTVFSTQTSLTTTTSTVAYTRTSTDTTNFYASAGVGVAAGAIVVAVILMLTRRGSKVSP